MFTEDDFHYLELQSVEKSDKGTYSCVITNHLGTATVSTELEVYGQCLSNSNSSCTFIGLNLHGNWHTLRCNTQFHCLKINIHGQVRFSIVETVWEFQN